MRRPAGGLQVDHDEGHLAQRAAQLVEGRLHGDRGGGVAHEPTLCPTTDETSSVRLDLCKESVTLSAVPVFAALADPTRRRLLELLAAGERSVGELAAEFDISRPGVSRHLRVLREAGLVRARGEGQRRLYSVDPAPLDEVDDWLARWRGFWAQRLDALDTELRRTR